MSRAQRFLFTFALIMIGISFGKGFQSGDEKEEQVATEEVSPVELAKNNTQEINALEQKLDQFKPLKGQIEQLDKGIQEVKAGVKNLESKEFELKDS